MFRLLKDGGIDLPWRVKQKVFDPSTESSESKELSSMADLAKHVNYARC